jgi:hypothetical protein
VQQRECRRGKVFLRPRSACTDGRWGVRFAGPASYRAMETDTMRGQLSTVGPGRRHGCDWHLFRAGRRFSSAKYTAPPDAHGMEDLLSSLSIPLFVMDLQELPSSGPLHEWFQMAHATGQEPWTMAPLRAYDAVFLWTRSRRRQLRRNSDERRPGRRDWDFNEGTGASL